MTLSHVNNLHIVQDMYTLRKGNVCYICLSAQSLQSYPIFATPGTVACQARLCP